MTGKIRSYQRFTTAFRTQEIFLKQIVNNNSDNTKWIQVIKVGQIMKSLTTK